MGDNTLNLTRTKLQALILYINRPFVQILFGNQINITDIVLCFDITVLTVGFPLFEFENELNWAIMADRIHRTTHTL